MGYSDAWWGALKFFRWVNGYWWCLSWVSRVKLMMNFHLIWIPVVYWWRESILGMGTVLAVVATQVSNGLMDTEDVFRSLVGHNLRQSFTCFLRWFHDLVLIVMRVSSICPGAKDKTDLSVWLMSEYFFKVMKAWKFPVKHWARRVQNRLGYMFISW